MKYVALDKLKLSIIDNDYNRWACDMLQFISNYMGWEDTETKFFYDFYKLDRWDSDKKSLWDCWYINTINWIVPYENPKQKVDIFNL